MFLLFGLRGGGRSRVLVATRLALLVAFLVVVFAFHPHGTMLDIVQGVRFALLATLVGFTLLSRRRRRATAVLDRD